MILNSFKRSRKRTKRVCSADAAANVTHKYPSSSHHTRDWDKLVAQMKADEKNEKLEGDAALNQLFQSVYKDGNEETRRAMNKSFVSHHTP